MAKMWNNQYYQDKELAGIRKTLANSMIGSHSRDVGDLRGMLAAEKTVEQVMRNRSSQNLAGQPEYGNQLMSLMGVQEPDYSAPGRLEAMQAQRRGIDPDTAPDALGSGGGAEAFDYDAAALNAIQRRNYQETSSALAGKSAWSQNPNLVSLALATLGDAKGNRALRTAQTSSETAQADQYTRAGVLSTAKANRITGQDEFIKTLLNDPKQVKAFLESYGQKDSGDAVKNQVLAGTILNAPNREQAAAALETAKNIAAKANLLEQKAGYWKSYAGQRESEAGESGAMVKPGSLYDSATSLVIDRKTGGLGTGVGSGDITVRPELKMVLVNLFLALLDPKGKKLTKKQRVANRIEGVKLLEEKGYSPDDGTAIYEYITKGEY